MVFNIRLLMVGLTALMMAAAARATAQSPAAPAAPPVPPDEEIRQILAERVDLHQQATGIVAGIIDASGRRVFAYGARARGGAPVDANTVFEIGSVTKVFTSLLLADAVRRGEVALADPVARHLPANVKVPQRGGRQISLQDLAQHTSGLPRLPDNMPFGDPLNPYADYTVEHMYAFLSSHELSRDIGGPSDYSNLGAGLLGHVLARRAGTDYETLVRTRITAPIGMTHTAITLTDAMKAALATGHNDALQPVPLWDLPALAGAGAIRSTANDLLTFLEAALGHRPSPLGPAFAATTATRVSGGTNADVGLGWQILKLDGTEIVWHNGGTGGYRSFVGFEPRSRRGVVVLANAMTAAGVDDIGRHLLNRNLPLVRTFPRASAPKPRIETKVDPSIFERYAGRYQLAPAMIITVTRESDRFYAQLTGQPRIEIFAESEKDYFLKVVDAVLSFETDAGGRAVAVVLHQNGVAQRARRIEGEPIVPREVTLAPDVLEGYVGRYRLPAGVMFTITRQEARLFAQLTGQPSTEVFASGPREFFYKVVDAQLTFETDSQGRATALVLRQNGVDQRFSRMADAPAQLSAETLQRYVGRYQATGGPVMTVTVQEGRLFAAPAGQIARELVLASERDFYVKEAGFTGRFEIDGTGRVIALVLLPSGTRAPRVD
jgi:CubicO group peptidase (beta-lactamase class C family)